MAGFESLLDNLAKIGGVPGVVLAIGILLYLRRQKKIDEKDEANQLREIAREQAYQDLVNKTVGNQATLLEKLAKSEEAQSEVLQMLTVVVERLSAATNIAKDHITEIKSGINTAKETALEIKMKLDQKE